MALNPTHAELEELLGAYALDAVEPHEAEAVERHLPGCPRCRAEVAGHREAAAALAHAGSPAPEGLWPRIAGALEEPPPRLDLGLLAAGRRRRGLPLRLAGALAAAAAAVIGVLGVQVARQDDRIDGLAAALRSDGIEEAARGALLDAGSRRVTLRSGDGRLFADAVVQADGQAFLVRHNLPPLPDRLTYQVWALVGGRMVSVGVAGRDPAVSAFRVDPERASVLAVTAEAAGGVPAPTGDPLVQATLGAA